MYKYLFYLIIIWNNFYILGVKAFIDNVYNIKMVDYPVKMFDGFILNEIKIKDLKYNNETIF